MCVNFLLRFEPRPRLSGNLLVALKGFRWTVVQSIVMFDNSFFVTFLLFCDCGNYVSFYQNVV